MLQPTVSLVSRFLPSLLVAWCLGRRNLGRGYTPRVRGSFSLIPKFPDLPTIQFLVTYTEQKQKGEAWFVYLSRYM